MNSSLFISLILAIVLWGLIGIERELPRSGSIPQNTKIFGWIRTFASISLLGALTVQVDRIFHQEIWMFFWAFMTTTLVTVAYAYGASQQHKIGGTTSFAALITYFIGMICMSQNTILAIILAIVYLFVLSTKSSLDRLKERFSRQELGDTLKFAIVALVILPILPDEKYSLLDVIGWLYHGSLNWTHPLLTTDFFNPYSIWFFVVVLTGIEYAGFILSKMIGSRWGILVSGIIGGIISSTATTVAMSRKSTEYPENRYAYIVATLIATCIMVVRVVILSWVIAPNIIGYLIFPATGMFLSLVIMTWFFFLRSRKLKTDLHPDAQQSHEHESPFQLGGAIQFAGVILFIKFVSMACLVYQDFIPPKISSYGIGMIAGLSEIDPIVITMASEAKSWVLIGLIAGTTILIAMLSNNLVKASIAYKYGEKTYGKSVLLSFGISMITGIILIVGMNFL